MSRHPQRLACLLATLGALAACDSGAEPGTNRPAIENPTGDCPAPDNGARPEYAPGDSTWLPDCKAPLLREYFRVFAESEQLAYMIPRPDGVVTTATVCAQAAPGSPLRALFDDYTLCAEQPVVSRINAMSPADALAIAHALHEHLRFTAEDAAVTPSPETSDVLAVCAERSDLAAGALSGLCKWEQDRDRARRAGEPVPTIARLPVASEAEPLAAALNELYGIAPAS